VGSSDAGQTSLSSVRLIGRFDPPTSQGEEGARPLRFAWSGTSFEVRFTGASIAMLLRAAPLAPHTVMIDGKAVSMAEKSTAYAVRVDGLAPVSIEVSNERERYDLATGLDPAAPHVVRVMREAEAFAGVHELVGVELGPGGRFLPPRAPSLRLEIIGDSITCGYGVLGKSERCPFTYETERASAAYGARLGQALDADVTTVCWSGRGVLRNYDGSTTATMPELYDVAVPADPPVSWSFAAAPRADAVIVSLGTNDFLGGNGRPLDLAAFEDAYVRFLRRVRDREPTAFVFLTTSPMLKAEPSVSGPGTVQELARARLERVVARRIAEGDSRIELVPLDGDATAQNRGCDGHPNADDNARIAARLEQVIRARLRR
jgi:lysophospholipase L1-like esterase